MKRAIWLLLLTLVLVVPGVVFAQALQRGPSFEVASVKRVAEDAGGNGARSTANGSVSSDPALVQYRHINLKSLLMRAYNLKPDQVIGPSWLDTELYEVRAKPPDGTAKDLVPIMLQNLLTERFHLSSHWESRQERGYALGVAKNGLRLKPLESSPTDGSDDKPTSVSFSSAGGINIKGTTMPAFADFLSRYLHVPVVDTTEVRGKFDISLDVPPAALFRTQPDQTRSESADDAASTGTSIESAVRSLGLILESRKLPIKRLVIDKAEKNPTEN